MQGGKVMGEPRIVEISDFNAPELDIYARLTENQLVNRASPSDGLFIAESPRVIERALDAGYTPVSLLLEQKHVEGQAKEIFQSGWRQRRRGPRRLR